MEDLKRNLTQELLQDINVKIMDTLSWSLPVHTVMAEYKTVMRTKMDILMKMMLITFKKEQIASIEEIGAILLVEPLFIEDLVSKMQSAHLIEKKKDFFMLTNEGIQQLESGIFSHEPEKDSKKMVYSPCHESFLKENNNSATYIEEKIYRYSKEFADWNVVSIKEDVLLNALRLRGAEATEENSQVVITEIITVSQIQRDLVPCIELRLYNEVEDVFYVRVWNTMLGHWDETVEAVLNEKELKTWREKYIKENTLTNKTPSPKK
ncbi:hypothetical protein ACFSFY_00970 [Sporosarcina siberiensis]|uniref:Uncharacterized protein n=1 Tax=Sporosarcina siberiensis TaxID=1365606 RepID=A0ABW4SBA3_9BACL